MNRGRVYIYMYFFKSICFKMNIFELICKLNGKTTQARRTEGTLIRWTTEDMVPLSEITGDRASEQMERNLS